MEEEGEFLSIPEDLGLCLFLEDLPSDEIILDDDDVDIIVLGEELKKEVDGNVGVLSEFGEDLLERSRAESCHWCTGTADLSDVEVFCNR